MSQAPVYAALDLGSNSFHLLIASFRHGKLVVLDDVKLVTQLAAGLDEHNYLAPECIEKALQAIRLFADRLRVVDKKNLRIIGTSSLRQAHNAELFLHPAEAILQAPIDVISGVEEARLIFLGVSKDYSANSQRLIMDIGGGSTECVIGQSEPTQLKSLHIGCVTYAVRFFPGGCISQENYQRALLDARAEIRTIAKAIEQSHWQEAIGASGTIRAIAQVINKQYQQPLVTLKAIERLASDMIQKTHCEQLDWLALSENRRYILPGGLAILQALFIELGIKEIHIANQAIREGIIYEMAGKKDYLGRRERTIEELQKQYHVDVEQANNVEKTALQLLVLIAPHLSKQSESYQLLSWAARLHEVGLLVNHSGYQKHGAYIIENSSMPGFSLQTQQKLAYLILNHRRKVRSKAIDERIPERIILLLCLRLACLFCRYRKKPELPRLMQLTYHDQQARLALPKKWLDKYPLSLVSLQREKAYLQNAGIELLIQPQKEEVNV